MDAMRRAVDRALKRAGEQPTGPGDWRALEPDAEAGVDADRLAAQLVRWREEERQGRPKRVPVKPLAGVAARDQALTAWAYRLAGTDLNVVNYRAVHLADPTSPAGWSPLPGDEVADWIETATQAGPSGHQLHPREWFDVFVPGQRYRTVVSAPAWGEAFGRLDELARLCEHLAEAFAWQPDEAAAFVLCAWCPQVRAVDARLRRRRPLELVDGEHRASEVDAFDRVTATLDPNLTPAQVAEWWRGVREFLGVEHQRPQRSRTVELARFAVGLDGDETGRRRAELWNEEHPDDAYARLDGNGPHHFTRDVRAAVDALLRVGYGPTE